MAQVWDLPTLKLLAQGLKVVAPLNWAGFSSDRKRLITASGNAARIWDSENGRLLAGPMPARWEAAAYAGAGTGFLIEAISTDLLNCRHYWLLLAVVVARCQSHRQQQQRDESLRLSTVGERPRP